MTNNAITHKLRGILACLWLLLAAIALLPYQASPTQAKPALQEEPKYNIVLLIDESGSMWCERCNDTEAPNLDVVPKDDWLPLYETPPMRLKAVEGLMANMAVEPKVTNFNVGIVAFHSKATTVTPLQQVGDADNLRNMIKALYQNHESVFKEWKDSAARGQPLTTNTAEAIQQAYDMLFEASGVPKIKEGKNVVLMISDGVPEVRGSSKSAEHSKTAQLVQKLTGNKAQFISLLIFNPSARPEAQVKDEDRNFWADLAKGPGAVQACDYWEVSDSKLLFQSTQNILRCILTGNTTQPPVFTLTEGTPKQFAVESYIKEVSVTIKKNNPRTVVEVLRPNGNPLPKMPSGTDAGDTISYRSVGSSESYRIAHPSGTTNSWVGCWTVTVKAAEEADKRVPVEFVPVAYAADYSLKFNRPEASVWQVGKPLPVEVELLDNNGQGINPTALGVNDPLSLLVRRPDDTSGSQPLPLQGASYTGQYKADVEGSYVFTATINAANLLKSSNLGCQSILQSQPGQIAAGRRIEMKLQPWLDLQSPKQGEQVRSDQFKAQAQVMMGNQGAQNDSLVQGEVKAEIINRNDGKVLTRFVLQRDKSQRRPLFPPADQPAGERRLYPGGELQRPDSGRCGSAHRHCTRGLQPGEGSPHCHPYTSVLDPCASYRHRAAHTSTRASLSNCYRYA
jgi:hypothetical protein